MMWGLHFDKGFDLLDYCVSSNWFDLTEGKTMEIDDGCEWG